MAARTGTRGHLFPRQLEIIGRSMGHSLGNETAPRAAVGAYDDSTAPNGGVWPLVLGGIGIVGSNLTLPASRAAVPALGGVFVGLGRALVAAGLAAVYLWLTRAKAPARPELRSLALVAGGVVFGFPLLSAVAMEALPAAHGAAVTGLIPAATAMAVWHAGERPPIAFWVACTMGVVAVLVFAAVEGAGYPQPGDLLLLGAVLAAGLGYAEGARLARLWGPGSGIRVIAWTLVLASPVVAACLITSLVLMQRPQFAHVGSRAWLGFAYVSVVSAYVAMFPWYARLARSGVARVGQIQLLQPVLTVGWAALLLGEAIHPPTIVAAAFVMLTAGVAVLTWHAKPTAAWLIPSGLTAMSGRRCGELRRRTWWPAPIRAQDTAVAGVPEGHRHEQPVQCAGASLTTTADTNVPLLRVRRARVEDAADVCRVIRRSIIALCVADHQNDPARLESWLANKTVASIADWIAASSIVMAERSGAIVGVGAVTSSGRVTLNYVAPEARFTGVSAAILAYLEEEAAAYGASECTLESTVTALQFYLSRGYAPQSEGSRLLVKQVRLA